MRKIDLNTAKDKLARGRLTLDKAGDDGDLLAAALKKIHGALEDACRHWLSLREVAQHHQLEVKDFNKVNWRDLPRLMSTYYQWTEEDIEYVSRINKMRNPSAHGDEFYGTRQELEEYILFVERLINENRQPVLQNQNNNFQSLTQTAQNINQNQTDFPRENNRVEPWENVRENLPSNFQNSTQNYQNIEQGFMFVKQKKNIALAYGLWGLGLFGLSGIHRLYLGKYMTGLLWLFSGGLFFVGQIIDLVLIPSMITQEPDPNLEKLVTITAKLPGIKFVQKILNKLDGLDASVQKTLIKSESPTVTHIAMQKLLEVAQAQGKVLSVGQAVMATGLPPEEVEKLLNQAVLHNIAHIGNDPESGAVRYYFDI